MTLSNEQIKRMLSFSILFIILPIVLSLLVLFAGIYIETGEVDLAKMFMSPIYSNYNYTLLESVLDFDKFLAEFWFSIVFCLILVGYVVIYGKSRAEFENGYDYTVLGRRSWTFGALAFVLFLFVLIGSMLSWGLNREYLSGRPFTILAENLFPEYFSEQLFALTFFAAGFSLIVYRTMRGFRDHEKWTPNLSGLKYLLLGLFIIELFVLIFPLKIDILFTGDTTLEILFMCLQTILIIGIIGFLEFKENSLYSKKQKDKVNNEDNSKGMDVSEYITQIKSFSKTRLGVHFVRFGIVLFLLFLVGVISFLIISPIADINVFRWIQQTLISIFRIFLCLFLYYLESFIQRTKILEEVE